MTISDYKNKIVPNHHAGLRAARSGRRTRKWYDMMPLPMPRIRAATADGKSESWNRKYNPRKKPMNIPIDSSRIEYSGLNRRFSLPHFGHVRAYRNVSPFAVRVSY